jgi:hypothetical protein
MDNTTSSSTFKRDGNLGSSEQGNLCKYCLAVRAWHWLPCESQSEWVPKTKYLEHHESWTHLKASSDGGCTLCTLLRAEYERFLLTHHYYWSHRNETWQNNTTLEGRVYLFLEYGDSASAVSESGRNDIFFKGFALRMRRMDGQRDKPVSPGDCFIGPFFQIIAPSGE